MNRLDGPEQSATHENPLNLTARLDRLPVIATHYIWALLLAVNLMLEYYDNAIFAYSIPTIKKHTDLSLEQVGVISSAFFVGMVIGALVGGRLSDKWGRRPIIVWSTVLYSLGALATAFAPNFEIMLTSRVITGIGVQAATSVLLVYIAEMFPSKARGRFVSIVTLGFVVSGVGAAALAMFFLPHGGPNAWRHLLIAGSVGLLIAPIVRYVLPESVRWCVSRGQIERAEKIVRKLEARALRHGPLGEPQVANLERVQEPSLHQLLRNKAVLRTMAVVTVGYFGSSLAYYLFANWGVYALIHGLQYTEEHAYRTMFIWNLVYCVTPFLTYLFLDRLERKTTILATSILSAIPLVMLGLSTSSTVVIVAGGATAIITGLVVNAYYTYIPETIPTRLRALGSGIVMSGGRFGGAASGVLGAALFSNGGIESVMLTAAACYVIFAIPVVLYGPRTTRRSLDQVTDQELGAAEGSRPGSGAHRTLVSHLHASRRNSS